GIPEDVIEKVQRATPDDFAFIKKMTQAASKKQSPKVALGETGIKRLDFIKKEAESVGEQMQKAIDNMMLKQPNVANPRQEMLQVLADNGIQINAKGRIAGTGQYTTEEARLLLRLVNELP